MVRKTSFSEDIFPIVENVFCNWNFWSSGRLWVAGLAGLPDTGGAAADCGAEGEAEHPADAAEDAA